MSSMHIGCEGVEAERSYRRGAPSVLSSNEAPSAMSSGIISPQGLHSARPGSITPSGQAGRAQACVAGGQQHHFSVTTSIVERHRKMESSLHSGLVDVRSKINDAADRAAAEALDPSRRSRWRPLDWFLGTQLGQFVGLILCSWALVLFGCLSWMMTGGNEIYDTSWWQALWFSWGMFFDPGTQMGFSAAAAGRFKAVAVTFSFLGFAFNLVFLGLIVEVVRALLSYWRRKRNRIVSNGHTILLGWNEKTLFVIDELRRSAENRDMPFKLVILADRDEFFMRQEVNLHFPEPAINRDIQIRQGSPCESEDLTRISVVSARDIIILGGSGAPRIVDLLTMRTVIALAALPRQPKCPIIAEVRAPETRRAIGAVLDLCEGIFPRDAVRRVLIATALRPVLGDVFASFMSWDDGAEIYVRTLEFLGVSPGDTVAEAQHQIPNGVVIGIRPLDELAVMSPPEDRTLLETDKLLVLADSLRDIKGTNRSRAGAVRRIKRKKPTAVKASQSVWFSSTSESEVVAEDCSLLSKWDIQRSLVQAYEGRSQTLIIVGWPSDIDDVLMAVDSLISPGSTVWIMSTLPIEARESRLTVNRTFHVQNFKIQHWIGNITSTFALAELPLRQASAVLVLTDDMISQDPRICDAAALAATITIDSLLKGKHPDIVGPLSENDPKPRLVCEVLSPETERALRTGKLHETAKFFRSGKMETGLFTMAASQTPVYNTLLLLLQKNDFGDMALVDLELYFSGETFPPQGKEFIEVFQDVRKKGDVLIGVLPPNSHPTASSIVCTTRYGEAAVMPGSSLLIITLRPHAESSDQPVIDTETSGVLDWHADGTKL